MNFQFILVLQNPILLGYSRNTFLFFIFEEENTVAICTFTSNTLIINFNWIFKDFDFMEVKGQKKQVDISINY